MILTLKCKEAFLGWSMYTEETFDLTQELFQHALIIDFFDSVGLGIDTYTYLTKENEFRFGSDIIATFDIINDSATINLGIHFDTRTQATTEAIKKANEIFNNRNHD